MARRVSCGPVGGRAVEDGEKGGALHRLLSVQRTSGSYSLPSARLLRSVLCECSPTGLSSGEDKKKNTQGLLPCNPSSLKAARRVELPHTRTRNDTEDLGKMCVNIRRLAFRTLRCVSVG